MSLFRKYHVTASIPSTFYIGRQDTLPENPELGAICLLNGDSNLHIFTGNNWDVVCDLVDVNSVSPPVQVKSPEEIDYEENVLPFLRYVKYPECVVNKFLIIRDILKAKKPLHTSRFRILS